MLGMNLNGKDHLLVPVDVTITPDTDKPVPTDYALLSTNEPKLHDDGMIVWAAEWVMN